MKHQASPRFWHHYQRLPRHIQRLADADFALLTTNPRHPSLRFKQVGRLWSARVGIAYRALAVRRDDGTVVWYWIGHHDEYMRIIRES